MPRGKKAATLKEVITKKPAPVTRKRAVVEEAETSEPKAAKHAKMPTLEQIVAKLEKHGIRFDEEVS